MGIYVVPFVIDGYDQGTGLENDITRTIELNFPCASVMAYASLSFYFHRNDTAFGVVGVKRVRQRKADGSIRTLNLGNYFFGWPRAWCGDNIVSVTFAGSIRNESSLEAVCVVHTW